VVLLPREQDPRRRKRKLKVREKNKRQPKSDDQLSRVGESRRRLGSSTSRQDTRGTEPSVGHKTQVVRTSGQRRDRALQHSEVRVKGTAQEVRVQRRDGRPGPGATSAEVAESSLAVSDVLQPLNDRSAEIERVAPDRSETPDSKEESSQEGLNDPSEQSNAMPERLNDPVDSERTLAERGRTNKNIGIVPASQAGIVPLVLSSVEGAGRSDAAVGRSLERSDDKYLTQFKTMVRNLRRYKTSYGVIESLSGGRGVGLAKSTIFSWAGDVMPEEDSATEQSGPNLAAENHSNSAIPEVIMPPQMGNGGEARQQFMPRTSSEVAVTRRPTIIEDEPDSTPSTGIENDGGDDPSPINLDILRLLSREPEWANVILSIIGCARSARVRDATDYYYTRMLEDSENMDLVRSLVPNDPNNPDSLRENLALIVRKSLAFDEATRKSGLATHDRSELGT